MIVKHALLLCTQLFLYKSISNQQTRFLSWTFRLQAKICTVASISITIPSQSVSFPVNPVRHIQENDPNELVHTASGTHVPSSLNSSQISSENFYSYIAIAISRECLLSERRREEIRGRPPRRWLDDFQ